MDRLKSINCFLLDMDGTFFLGSQIIDGALDFIDTLRKQGKRFIFLTNNSSMGKTAYREKLNGMGCGVGPDDIFTSGEAAIIYLKSIKEGARIFLMGTPYLEDEFERAGFILVKGRDIRPDFVVLGFDKTLTYEKIWIACDFLRDGVPYIATHPDINCPIEGRKYMPDTGSMIKLFEASTGRLPTIIGKPYKYIVNAVTAKYNLKKDEVAMVGDRLYTDIRLGKNSGITSILVLTGETTLEDYQSSDIQADCVFPSIKELGEAIR